MKIAWSIKIPKGAKVKVKDGESVEIGELVYEYNQNVVERIPVLGWQALNVNDRKTILQNIIKRELIDGEVLKKRTWLSSVEIKSPGKGKCLGVDEFGNMELEILKSEKYIAPISAKKVRMEDDPAVAGQVKLVFELKGSEFECSGENDYKAWGNYSGLIVNDLSQIGVAEAGRVVVVDGSIDCAIKAEAIGAAGLILVNMEGNKELEECDIPIVSMSDDQLKKMNKFVDEKQVKIWLNAPASKVIVVLE